MQVTAGLIAAGNKLLLKIHGNKSTSKEVIHIPSYRSEVIYGGTWFSNSRGVVCKMLKQAIWKVLSKRVVSDSGDKFISIVGDVQSSCQADSVL
ncbi:hypothetical protein ES319_1Z107600v1 [Gossypium barbadense]|uniref:Uncharacterized protein n=2 Tax=Gossypium TaxID=3633 RepID=A0A5J5N6Z0_GOSBA|nr:hypothetical protein ES319_1Z107600v1 [Gossypium barbadense]TYG46502.1 hypothetical protein ES288_D11G260600v1 [Gossypium darwinii]